MGVQVGGHANMDGMDRMRGAVLGRTLGMMFVSCVGS